MPLNIVSAAAKDEAFHEAEKVLVRDPSEEAAVERLMRLKLMAGDRTEAVRIYKRYEKILKEELGLSPSGKILGLISDTAI